MWFSCVDFVFSCSSPLKEIVILFYCPRTWEMYVYAASKEFAGSACSLVQIRISKFNVDYQDKGHITLSVCLVCVFFTRSIDCGGFSVVDLHTSGTSASQTDNDENCFCAIENFSNWK